MLWCRVLILCFLIELHALTQSTVEVVERIVHQAFHSFRELNTILFWDVSQQSILSSRSYPRKVFDYTTGFKTTLGENCLVIMDLNPSSEQDIYDRINSAFNGAKQQHLAKFVVVLDFTVGIEQTILMIDYYFGYMNIMCYVIVISNPNGGSKEGYMLQKQFIELNATTDFEVVCTKRLQTLPLRAVITGSRPYSYLSDHQHVIGLDIEIAKIVADKMNISITVVYVEHSQFKEIPKLMVEKKVDAYLTRRGCNSTLRLPQLRLQEKIKLKMLMPNIRLFNFNLQFLKPYKTETWWMLLVAVIITCSLNLLFCKRMKVNILMVVIFGYHRRASRFLAMLILVIQFLKFILLEAYLGQVTSFMIRLRYQENPQTLEQFFASNILLNAPTVMNQFFDHLPVAVSEPLKKQIKQPQEILTEETGFYEPGFAYIVTDYASDAIGKEMSDRSPFNPSFFYIMREPLYEVESCYMFGLWSPFIVKFKEWLERLYGTGIILKLTNDAWRLQSSTLRNDLSEVLMFSDLVPLFLFLCYGWLLSMICFSVEMCIRKDWKRMFLYDCCFNRLTARGIILKLKRHP